jgi:hypothetical protein
MHARVTAGHHVAEIADGDARVEHGGREMAMAEQHLDVAQIGAAAEHMRRAGVAQRMRCELEAEAATVVWVNTTEPCRLFSPPRNPESKCHPHRNDREWTANQYRSQPPGYAVLSEVHVKSPIPPDC